MRFTALFLLPLTVAAAVPVSAAETVPVPAFRSVELRGGGKVVIRPGPARVTLVSGSTQFTRFRADGQGQLKIDACGDRCPPDYNLVVEIQYPSVLPMGVKGGGTITAASGFGPQHTVAAGVGGGGLIDLRSVTAQTVAAGVDGGGTIRVGASKTLAAAVSGGGEVRYTGNPRVTTVINGGGTVSRLD